MDKQDPDAMGWIERWKAAAPMLSAVEAVELTTLSPAARRQQIENLLDLGYQFRRLRRDNGLVELKRHFSELFGQ